MIKNELFIIKQRKALDLGYPISPSVKILTSIKKSNFCCETHAVATRWLCKCNIVTYV